MSWCLSRWGTELAGHCRVGVKEKQTRDATAHEDKHVLINLVFYSLRLKPKGGGWSREGRATCHFLCERGPAYPTSQGQDQHPGKMTPKCILPQSRRWQRRYQEKAWGWGCLFRYFWMIPNHLLDTSNWDLGVAPMLPCDFKGKVQLACNSDCSQAVRKCQSYLLSPFRIL